jgi:hypothetical protein
MENEIKELLEKNLAMTEEIRGLVLTVKKHIFWQQVFGLVKLLIILVPIILGLIFLPPLIGAYLDQYKQLFDLNSAGSRLGMEKPSSELLKAL